MGAAVKTASKKAAVKKTVRKSAAPRAKNADQAKPALVHASEHEAFWMTDGRILRNLIDLREALSSIDTAIFSHHVSKDKNDFADWVGQVLGDAACAADLRMTTRPKPAHTIVVKYLKLYNL